MEAEQLLNSINNVDDCALIILDADLKIQYYNKGAEMLFKCNNEEFSGRVFDFLYQADKTQSLFSEATINKKAVYEGWLKRKDETKFWGSVSASLNSGGNENTYGYTLMIRDITQQREREDYIKNIEDWHYKMINEVEDYAILLLSKEGYIQNWNKGAEKLKGYTPEEIIGKNFEIFYTKEDAENRLPQTLLKRASENGRAVQEGWRMKKNGSKFWANVTITSLHDIQGNVIGFSKVTRDLTERMLAELNQKKYLEQLESKNKDLEQMVYITSHDLQEPLRTITGFIAHFAKEFKPDISENAGMYLKYINEAAGRMSNFIKALLDYAKLGNERNLSEIDLNEVLKDLITDLTSLIKDADAKIVIEPLPKIMGYRVEIQQLFQNLISNAIKFTKSGTHPKINIKADLKDNYYEFSVSDNGIGIDPAHYENIFMMFQRLHSRNEYEGTGIGLTNCKKIVELHGGKIWVNSIQGEGSTFNFTIPYKHPL